jgi:phage anti-repressor protein
MRNKLTMANIILSKDLVQSLINSTDAFPVDFDDAWEWLGYTRKSSAKKKLTTNFEEGTDYCTKWCKRPDTSASGFSPYEEIRLTVECFKELGMLAQTEKGKLVRKYYLQCERVVKTPKTALELAREQVKLLEQLELQSEQIKLLEADNLRQSEAIDELFEYSSIIRVAKFNGCDEKAFSWHKLKAASKALSLEVKQVPCPRFETKNLYSHTAWRFVYPEYRLPETTTLIVNPK